MALGAMLGAACSVSAQVLCSPVTDGWWPLRPSEQGSARDMFRRDLRPMTTLEWLVGGGAQLQARGWCLRCRMGISLRPLHWRGNSWTKLCTPFFSSVHIVESFDTSFEASEVPILVYFQRTYQQNLITKCRSAQDAVYRYGKLSASDQQSRHPPLYQQNHHPQQLKPSSPNRPGPSALSSRLNHRSQVQQKRGKPSPLPNYTISFVYPPYPCPSLQPKSSP